MNNNIPIQLTFYGVRGSCAAPFPDRSEYGGNTSCVALRQGSVWIICDSGTGILSALEDIRSAEKGTVHIFISHLHLDHISALPMFLAKIPKEFSVHIWGTDSCGKSNTDIKSNFSEMLQKVLCPPVWPVTLKQMCSQLIFHDLTIGKATEFENNMHVIPVKAEHPDGAANFRFEIDSKTIYYGLDCEITPESMNRYIEASEGSDIILFDGAYTESDYRKYAGFGHSSMSLATAVRQLSRAKDLWILHYDYSYTDDFLHDQEKVLGSDEHVHFAKEGISVNL